jgi:hypothetical protein
LTVHTALLALPARTPHLVVNDPRIGLGHGCVLHRGPVRSGAVFDERALELGEKLLGLRRQLRWLSPKPFGPGLKPFGLNQRPFGLSLSKSTRALDKSGANGKCERTTPLIS